MGTLPAAAVQPSEVAVVVMHGKGGTPNRGVDGFANGLQAKGFQVANLEMPWSKNREYDASSSEAVNQVERAFEEMKVKGAQKRFISGLSQGGAFALYYASVRPVDGIVALAPATTMTSPFYLNQLGDSLDRAKAMIADGKGQGKDRFTDFEASKGKFNVRTTATNYLDWFGSEGAMNSRTAITRIGSRVPVLWAIAERDIDALVKANLPMFSAFQGNPLSQLFRPQSGHYDAPDATLEEAAAWMLKVAASAPAVEPPAATSPSAAPPNATVQRTSTEDPVARGRAKVILGKFDSDQSGFLTPDEAPPPMKPNFEKLDKNGDGRLDEDELVALPPAR